MARSNVEAEYHAIALVTCELIWIKQLIQQMKFAKISQMKLFYDNQVGLHIASNPIFHEKRKHIKMDCHSLEKKCLLIVLSLAMSIPMTN